MTRLRPFILPLLVLAVMLSVTWLVWDHERQNNNKQLRSQFDFLLSETVSRVEQRMSGYEQMLRGVQGLLATTEIIDPDNFRAYIDSLQLDANYSGIQSIGVIEAVQGEHTSTLVTAMYRFGAVNPIEHSKIDTPAGSQIGSNRALSSLDQWLDPVKRAAMEKSRDTGMPAISACFGSLLIKRQKHNLDS